MVRSSRKTERSKAAAGHAAAVEMPSRDALLERARRWESELLGGPITYYPVRHHSPACAMHLARWIQRAGPDAIVVEGPRSMDKWIPALVSDQCVAPVAILSTYRESNSPRSPRHSAFFPLCDYSPEWVAIRRGRAMGARIRFADLEFADKVRFQNMRLTQDQSPRSLLGVLLADESHLRHSQFIDRLVRRIGCRDFDELWDHLFESQADRMTTEAFVGLLATYCDLSRQSHDAEYLKNDATLAREAVMTEVIWAEYKRLGKPQRQGALLVVTGGFHTVALPKIVRGKGNPNLAQLEGLDESLTGSWLIRYSYDQLDALAGYRSGMPSPGFYDALWHAETLRDKRRAVAELISVIARETRGKPIPHEASVTDSIAALQMLDRLTELRGHDAPTRSDLLDAIASCMRKESAAGNDLLSAITHRVLAGQRIGSVPAAVGHPPIVDDFHRLATELRLPVDTIASRGVTFELYRKPAHRAPSFLLHQLRLLDVPYATYVDGPDFINGYRLGKLREQWSVAWSPGTEAGLAEHAALGDSVAGAAAAVMMQRVEQLEEEGAARNAEAAVDLLIRACRCGLHDRAAQILAVVQSHLAEDQTFASVASGLGRLMLLRAAREPLEAKRLGGISELIVECYHRAANLVDSLAAVPDDQLDASLDGLLSIREILASQEVSGTGGPDQGREETTLDGSLFFEALERLIHDSGSPPRSEIAGAAAGLLHGVGRIEPKRVCEVVQHFLDAAVQDVSDACGVVRGLMITAREAFWRMDGLLQSIDDLFRHWEETRFNNALPHLRLAFSQLSPKEVDRVASRVAGLHAVDEIGPLINPDVTEDEMELAVRASAIMNRSLAEDGLK